MRIRSAFLSLVLLAGSLLRPAPAACASDHGAASLELYGTFHAMGIIACELFTGERPASGVSVTELFTEAGVEEGLVGIAQKALARSKNPPP